MSNRKRSRSRSPAFRSRSKSPGEWKRPERRGNGRSSRSEKIVRLYVSNLPYEVKWPELKDLFKDKVGNEVSYAQMYEDPDGRPSGAAVVEIKSREAAENAIKMLDRSEFRGRKIIVREEREKDRMRHTSSSRQEQGRSDDLRTLISGSNGRGFTMDLMHQLGIEVNQITSQVFVANLDYKVTKDKLEEVFRIAGNVIEAEIKTDKEGKSRGMGIVRFEHPIEAVQAISLFTNQYLYDRQLFVRMDKWVDPIMQDIPSRLPNGLRGIGVGMGARGHPLLNIGEIANTIALGLLTGQLGSSQLGFQTNNLGLTGSSSNQLNTNLSAANILSAVPGLLGNAGLSNIGANALDGNHLLNQVNSGSGLAQTAQQAASVLLTSLGLNALAGLSNADLSSNIGNGLISSAGNVGGGGVAEMTQYSTPQGNAVNSSSSFNLTHSSYESRDQNFERNYDRGMNNERTDPRSAENATVFVKNIPFNFSTQNMYEKFRDCGDIKYAEIKTDGSGRSRGYGLVQFYNSDSARRAISMQFVLCSACLNILWMLSR